MCGTDALAHKESFASGLDALTEWNMLSQESLHLDSMVTIVPKVIRMHLKITLSIDPWWYAEGLWLIDRLICCSCPFRSCSHMRTETGSHQSARKCQETFNLWLHSFVVRRQMRGFCWLKGHYCKTLKTKIQAQMTDDRFLKSSSIPSPIFSFFLSECAHLWPFKKKKIVIISSHFSFLTCYRSF